MAKTLGKLRTQTLKLRELEPPKGVSKGTTTFVRKHVYVVHPDANENGDDVFKATNVKRSKRSPDHGYEPGEDEDIYENFVVESLKSIKRVKRNRDDIYENAFKERELRAADARLAGVKYARERRPLDHVRGDAGFKQHDRPEWDSAGRDLEDLDSKHGNPKRNLKGIAKTERDRRAKIQTASYDPEGNSITESKALLDRASSTAEENDGGLILTHKVKSKSGGEMQHHNSQFGITEGMPYFGSRSKLRDRIAAGKLGKSHAGPIRGGRTSEPHPNSPYDPNSKSKHERDMHAAYMYDFNREKERSWRPGLNAEETEDLGEMRGLATLMAIRAAARAVRNNRPERSKPQKNKRGELLLTPDMQDPKQKAELAGLEAKIGRLAGYKSDMAAATRRKAARDYWGEETEMHINENENVDDRNSEHHYMHSMIEDHLDEIRNMLRKHVSLMDNMNDRHHETHYHKLGKIHDALDSIAEKLSDTHRAARSAMGMNPKPPNEGNHDLAGRPMVGASFPHSEGFEHIAAMSESDQALLVDTYNSLTEENQEKFLEIAESEEGCEKLLDFCITSRGND